MRRTVISLVIALVGSVVGVLLLAYGGGNTVAQIGRFGGPETTALYQALAVAGCLLLAAAAASVCCSPVGAIVAGGVHLAFSLVAVIVPYSPFEGVVSPALLLLNGLWGIEPGLATGAVYFVAFGAGLLIGAALLAVGILSWRGQPSVLWRVLSALGGLLALGPAMWVFAAGGDFYRGAFQVLKWDVTVSAVLVIGALLFGALLAPSGRSAIGAWIAGGVLSLLGVILLFIDPVAFAGMPPAITSTLPVIGWSGTLLAVGATVLGLALGVTLRPASVPAQATGGAAYSAPAV